MPENHKSEPQNHKRINSHRDTENTKTATPRESTERTTQIYPLAKTQEIKPMSCFRVNAPLRGIKNITEYQENIF